MGDPKKQKKKFSKPAHPWQKERIEAEKLLLKDYGLRRKYEIWKMDSLLKSFLNRAKTIIGKRTLQSELEMRHMLDKLASLGLLGKDSKLEDVLNLTLKNVMDRRLQTLLYKKGMAKTIKQAREFIVHEHVAIGSRKVTSPSYLVSVSEEPQIKMAHSIQLQAAPVKREAQQKGEQIKAEAKE